MEKGTSRVILFDKKAHSVQVAPKREKKAVSKAHNSQHGLPTESKVEKKKEPIENQSETIIRWLENHDLIKIRALCVLAGLDPGNFHRWVNVKKEIPVDVIEKIIPILKDYGFEDGL